MIPAFNQHVVPILRKYQDYNEDLFLGSFTKRELIWAGSQKKGATPDFTAASYLGHIAQAVQQDFPLSTPIPLPPEIISSIDWISTTDPEQALAFWSEQLSSVRRLVEEAAPTQKKMVRFHPARTEGCAIALLLSGFPPTPQPLWAGWGPLDYSVYLRFPHRRLLFSGGCFPPFG